MLHKNNSAVALRNTASNPTLALQRSDTSSSQGSSYVECDDSATVAMMSCMRRSQEVPHTGAQPITITTSNVTLHQAALSSKGMRHRMLATELTASLRRSLLWERKQNNQTTSALLKRMLAKHNVTNVEQFDEKVHLVTENEGDCYKWNPDFHDYNSNGW